MTGSWPADCNRWCQGGRQLQGGGIERPSGRRPLLHRLHALTLLLELDRGGRRGLRAGDAEFLVQARLDVLEDSGVQLEEVPRVFASLPDPLAAVAEPGAALLDEIVLDGEVEEVAVPRDPLPVEDVELHSAAGGRDLVLHHMHAGPRSDRRIAALAGPAAR